MEEIDCQLICNSSAEHLTQIYTGFGLLAEQKLIHLTIRKSKDFEPGMLARPVLSVLLNNRVRVVYDVFDGEFIDADTLANCNCYFKRSFSPQSLQQIPNGQKVYPLGLNYPVYGGRDFSLRRVLWSLQASRNTREFQGSLVQLVRSSQVLAQLFRINGGRFTSSIGNLEATPQCSDRPHILFVARLWDPDRIKQTEFAEERHLMNALRVECVRGLRLAFGDLFVGGLEPTEYARRHYPKEIVEDIRSTKKEKYLRLMKTADICVSTAGLRGSNPWKLGEYVAASRAIVSEGMHFRVTGDFRAEQNYLEFSRPEECIAQVSHLLEHRELRYSIMRANYEYYHQYLRPDRLVWHTLRVALENTRPNEQYSPTHSSAPQVQSHV